MQDKLEQNPSHSSIGSANLNRTLATTGLFSIYHPDPSQFIISRKSFCCGNLQREFPQSQLIIFSICHLAEILRRKSTARISLVSPYLLLNLSPGGNSAADLEIHSKNFPSLSLLSPRAALQQSQRRRDHRFI